MRAVQNRRHPIDPAAEGPDSEASSRGRLRFESIFASAWLAFGVFVLPAVIYAVGAASLGPYGENQGLGAFYVDFFRHLTEPSGRSWSIALGPVVMISLLRLVFMGVRSKKPADAASHKQQAKPTAEQSRVEPRVGLD